MKVYIKNKIFSLGDDSSVFDAQKNTIFKVKGNFFSFSAKKSICDVNGNVIFTLKNRLWNWFKIKVYIFDNDDNLIATVTDKPFNFKKDYYVEGYKDNIIIDGKFFSLSCQILRNGIVIGTIRRQIDFFADAFELEADEQDIPFLVALVIAIDNIVDAKSIRMPI